jgi:hypothetical protein
LAAALNAQASKSPLPVIVEADGIGRFPQDTEAAVYFCCMEALQNTAKYAHATQARICLQTQNRSLNFTVSDDGTGYDARHIPMGSGLRNMAEPARCPRRTARNPDRSHPRHYHHRAPARRPVSSGDEQPLTQACTSVGVCASALEAARVAVMVAVTELHHCQAAVGTSMGLPRTVRPLPSWTTGATSLLPLLAGSLWGASTRPMTDRCQSDDDSRVRRFGLLHDPVTTP